jgi:hypothetical protein
MLLVVDLDSSFESDRQGVQRGLPPRDPACSAAACRVEASHGQIQAFQSGAERLFPGEHDWPLTHRRGSETDPKCVRTPARSSVGALDDMGGLAVPTAGFARRRRELPPTPKRASVWRRRGRAPLSGASSRATLPDDVVLVGVVRLGGSLRPRMRAAALRFVGRAPRIR